METIKKYLPAIFFFGSLGFNYHQHKHDRPTVCSGFLRPVLHTETKTGKVVAVGISAAVFGWLAPHLTLDKNQHHVI